MAEGRFGPVQGGFSSEDGSGAYRVTSRGGLRGFRCRGGLRAWLQKGLQRQKAAECRQSSERRPGLSVFRAPANSDELLVG